MVGSVGVVGGSLEFVVVYCVVSDIVGGCVIILVLVKYCKLFLVVVLDWSGYKSCDSSWFVRWI